MIMVPEGEYLTLLNMIKNGNDYLGKEKIKKELEMSNILRDPKLTEFEKGHKYDWLYKQRRQLKREIENEAEKPKKVLIDPDQLGSIKSDLAKYLGVSPPTTTKQQQKQEQQHEEKPQKQRNRRTNRNQSTPAAIRLPPITTNIRPTELESTPKNVTSPKQQQSTSKQTTTSETEDYESATEEDENPKSTASKYIIHPKYFNDMIKIIKQNSAKLGVNSKGEILLEADKKQPIPGSDYKKIVHYLTGKLQDKPLGTDILVERMQDKSYYKKAIEWADWHRQRGEGFRKNKILPFHLFFTKGLVRVPPPHGKKISDHKSKFRPIIWQRL